MRGGEKRKKKKKEKNALHHLIQPLSRDGRRGRRKEGKKESAKNLSSSSAPCTGGRERKRGKKEGGVPCVQIAEKGKEEKREKKARCGPFARKTGRRSAGRKKNKKKKKKNFLVNSVGLPGRKKGGKEGEKKKGRGKEKERIRDAFDSSPYNRIGVTIRKLRENGERRGGKTLSSLPPSSDQEKGKRGGEKKM